MTTVPADADAVARFPSRDATAELVDHARHFVARNSWILQARPVPLPCEFVAHADSASLDFDANLA